MASSPVSDWLRGVPSATGLNRGDYAEFQLMRQQLEASKAEVANLRLQLRVSEKAASLATRTAASVDRLSPTSRVEAYIARQRLLERGASEVPADRWAASAGRRLSDPLGPLDRFNHTHKEEHLLDACIERDRVIQELRTELDTQRYLLAGDGRSRSSRAVLELHEAHRLIQEQRREIRALQEELITAERRYRTAREDAIREQTEVIDLQEALLQEKSFEIDRLRKLLQEQKAQIALLQAASVRTAAPAPRYDEPLPRLGSILSDRPPYLGPTQSPPHTVYIRSPPQSTSPLRPLDSPAASIPRYSPLHPPSRFDDPALPGRWDPTLPPRDPATVGYPDPVTHEVPERDVGFPPTRRESPGDGAEEVQEF